jgi:hypothetical protein
VLENALNGALKPARKFYEKCQRFYFGAFCRCETLSESAGASEFRASG